MADHEPVHDPATGGVAVYAKGLTALAGTVIAAYSALKSGGFLSVEEITAVLIALAGAVTVVLVPNLDGGPLRFTKGIAAFLFAAATALPTFLTSTEALSARDWTVTVVQVIFAAAVVVVPNAAAVLREAAEGLEYRVDDVPEVPGADTSGDDLDAPEEVGTGMLPAVTATSTPADLTAAASNTSGRTGLLRRGRS